MASEIKSSEDDLSTKVKKDVQTAIKRVFPENPDLAAGSVRLIPSPNSSNVEYKFKFHCGPIAKSSKLDVKEVANRIKEKFICNSRYYKAIKVTDNNFVNIYLEEPISKECKCRFEILF